MDWTAEQIMSSHERVLDDSGTQAGSQVPVGDFCMVNDGADVDSVEVKFCNAAESMSR